MKLPFRVEYLFIIPATLFVLLLTMIYYDNITKSQQLVTALITPTPTRKIATAAPTRAPTTIPTEDNSSDSPTPTTYLHKLNLTFSLPTGWRVVKETLDFVENEAFERYVLISGQYKLEVGTLSTGRAVCAIDQQRSQYVPLVNKTLGNIVYRDNPHDFSASVLGVCANLVNPQTFDYMTKIGSVDYILPPNWTEAKLKEMDKIVESIKAR